VPGTRLATRLAKQTGVLLHLAASSSLETVQNGNDGASVHWRQAGGQTDANRTYAFLYNLRHVPKALPFEERQ
jgi:hypothetical protein